MAGLYEKATSEFRTIIDFLRFGLSCANKLNLYYGHGTDNAWDDMLALIFGSLSLPIDTDPMLLEATLTKEEKQHLSQQLERRILSRIPVPYLTHQAYFCDLQFYVDERVLIPRSPIAELIEKQFAPWINVDRVEKVLDLCTGSACIAIACCYVFPNAFIDAVDLSKNALAVAEMNRQRHGLQHHLTLIESDCFTAVPLAHYDIIVSNPPYVSTEEMQTLPEEYSHEPRFALEAMKGGLAIVEQILFNAHRYLAPHGILVVEVGNSEEALIKAYSQVSFTWLDFERGGQGVFLLTYQQLKDYFSGLT